MQITREMIAHVAALARLRFGEEELEGFTEQLNEILRYMEKLNELDTSDVEPTSHMFFTKTPMREDKVREEPAPTDRLLENAPQRKDTFFVVPRVIE
ncbi:MAG: Asp-tRNA(Asn)/Glu-tRNA(Gln) amidotransferase subunit GatC [Candidatus Abyssubacteria bacterium]